MKAKLILPSLLILMVATACELVPLGTGDPFAPGVVWQDVLPGSGRQPTLDFEEGAPYPNGTGVAFSINGVVDERCSCRPNGFDATGPREGSTYHIYPSVDLEVGDVLQAGWTGLDGGQYYSTYVVQSEATTTQAPSVPTPTTETSVASTTTTSTTTTTTTTSTVPSTSPSAPTTSPSAPTTTTSSPSSGRTFLETFDGDPASPKSVMNTLDGWLTSPIIQGSRGWDNEATPMTVQHGTDCSPPPATRPIGSRLAETVFQCKNHVMTAINPKSAGTANSLVNLQPNHTLDLSGGKGKVAIDVSTKSPTPGSWWEIWLTPKKDWLQHPSDHWLHMSGVPRRSVKIGIHDFDTDKRLHIKGMDNYNISTAVFGEAQTWQGKSIVNKVSLDDRSRDKYEVQIDGTTLSVFITRADTGSRSFVRSVTMPNGFLGDDVVVQFLDANYEPDLNGKFGCSSAADCPVKRPATWHWDNAEISPAKPYELIKADKYVVNGGYVGGDNSPQKLTFERPAPANADLVFVGQATNNDFDVSFDGGNTWVDPTPVRGANDPPNTGIAGGKYDFLSYRVDAPQGASEVLVRGRGTSWSTRYEDGWGAMSFAFVTI